MQNSKSNIMRLDDQILDIELIIDGDQLVAKDHTMPTLLGDNIDTYYEYYVEIEYLAHRTEDNVVEVKMQRPEFNTIHISTFDLNYNGTYYYCKLAIPILDYFVGKNLENMVGEVFVDTSGTLMQIKYKPLEATSSGILATSSAISCNDAYNAILHNLGAENEANESYFFVKKEVFSTCKIRKCLVNLQHRLLLENCTLNSCTTSTNLRNTRDFLFGALYVLDYLKETNNFEEAQRIVDNLSTCDFPCVDDSVITNDCGCGNFI